MSETRTIDTEPLSPEEIKAIAEKLDGHWRTFYKALYITGVRVGELLAVRRRDFIMDAGAVVGLTIRRLKQRDRGELDRCPLPVSLGAEILELVRQSDQAMAFVWHKRSRTGRTLNALEATTQRSAHKALVRAAEAAGVRVDEETDETSVHPHLYRHSFGRGAARHLQSLGLSDIETRTTIQRMLGHANFATSAVYLKQSQDEADRTWRDLQTVMLEEA